MSDILASPPYILSGSHRPCTAGDAIPRAFPLHIPQLTKPLDPSHAPLAPATMLINRSDNCDRRTTGSQRITNTRGATHNSP
jgi:hypothetical protein